jgi:mono/diheme cytochrome c family protein
MLPMPTRTGRRQYRTMLLALGLALACALPARPAVPAPSADQQQFFRKEVLPILKASCFSCHGGEKKIRGGLRLTTRAGLMEGGDNGPAIVPERPQESLLLRAINYDEPRMPPRGKLPQAQIEVLTRWVRMGAPYAEEAPHASTVARHGPPAVDDQARAFWSFRPVVRPPIPAVKDRAWVRNPVDAFVLAGLEEKGLAPAAPATRTTLLRRVHYAITGLPPSPAEVDAFLADSSPDAYEKVVDQLLASPRYGEHLGRHWLDLVRFAETNSFERDGPKPNAWKYRDYVIRSFNQDRPYDRFVREQLAGDELQPTTRDGIIATGYYRLGIWDDEPADRDLSYYDQLDDIVSTTGQTFLGLTVGCARCHDHKIDPFPQKDYYGLLAFFHGINSYGNGPASQRALDQPADTADRADFERKLADLDTQMRAIEESLAVRLTGGEKDDFKYPSNRLSILRQHIGGLVSQADFNRYQDLRRRRRALTQNNSAAGETTLAVLEQGARARDTHILLRGMPAARGERVEPIFPSVLARTAPVLPVMPAGSRTCGRRKVLADWIADAKNPLTARVLVNRLFQYNFGRGIVRSSSNFGYQGTPPTHPELLDFLAAEFVAGGWKIKPIQRLLLTSNAFRMSSVPSSRARELDPENDRLSHFDLRRLTAEEVRDSILAVSGNLNLQKTDGPSVYPVIPPEVLAGQSQPGNGWGHSTPHEAAARSVFVYVKRSLAVPLLAVFDMPDPDATCPVRFTTTQPSQALALLNSRFSNEQAGLFADSLRRESGDPATQVRLALRRVLQRSPTDREVERGLRFLAALGDGDRLPAGEALRRFCLLALNLNEFLYLD